MTFFWVKPCPAPPLQLHKWKFIILCPPTLGFAIVHVGYLSEVFVYAVDKRESSPERWEYGSKMPFALGVEMSASSVEGCTSVTPVLPVVNDATLQVCTVFFFHLSS